MSESDDQIPQKAKSFTERLQIHAQFMDQVNLRSELTEVENGRKTLAKKTLAFREQMQQPGIGGINNADIAVHFVEQVGFAAEQTELCLNIYETFNKRRRTFNQSKRVLDTVADHTFNYAPIWLHIRKDYLVDNYPGKIPSWMSKVKNPARMYDILSALGSSIVSSPRSLDANEFEFVSSLLVDSIRKEQGISTFLEDDTIAFTREQTSTSELLTMLTMCSAKDILEQTNKQAIVMGGKRRKRRNLVLGLSKYMEDALIAVGDLRDSRHVQAQGLFGFMSMDADNELLTRMTAATAPIESLTLMMASGICYRDLTDGSMSAVSIARNMFIADRNLGQRIPARAIYPELAQSIETASSEFAYRYAQELNELFNWKPITGDDLPLERGLRVAVFKALNTSSKGQYSISKDEITQHYMLDDHEFSFVEIFNMGNSIIEFIVVTDENKQLRFTINFSNDPGAYDLHLLNPEEVRDEAVESLLEMISETINGIFDEKEAEAQRRKAGGKRRIEDTQLGKRRKSSLQHPIQREASSDDRNEFTFAYDFTNCVWPNRLRGKRMRQLKQKVGRVLNNLFDEHGSPNYNYEKIEGENDGLYRVAIGKDIRIVMYWNGEGFDVLEIFQNHQNYLAYLAKIKHLKG